MKRFMFLMCLVAMMVASTGLKAQEVTITLNPGYTWISYLGTESQDLTTALGSFTPAVGDIITSQWGSASYIGNGRWRGNVSQFDPGYGYKYYSNRTEPVMLTFQIQQPASQVVVTTMELTNITATSVMVGGSVTLDEGNHIYARGVCYDTVQMPTVDCFHTNDSLGAGDFTTTLIDLTPNTTYYVRAYVVTDYGLAYGEEVNFTTLDSSSGGHDYVDLGLPSGTLWAACNVGANAPEEYGDYFAWGETQPKETYNWNTYQYCNGSEITLTKYCNNSEYGYNGFTDTLIILLPEDDAAAANWGGDWHMPTKEEWVELYNNTTSIWTTQNGVNGYLFTASNGSSLFLPAAGYRNGNSLYSESHCGYYWSNSLCVVWSGGAWSLFFASGSPDIDGHTRYSGLSVRPVRTLPQNNAPTGAINGKFTINEDGDQVYFSKGNLQYIGSASTPYWRFAENQWDCLGITTGQNSNDQNVDRDLFGWGTSGWDCGNICYHPWDINNASGSSYGPAGANNLTGNYANSDWGVYNPISNGGNQPNQWRILTKDEYGYVFNTRTTDSGIRYAKANVNNVNGVVLLPDDWSTDYFDLNDTNTNDANYANNTITASEWSTLEQHGAVFLPATGYRFGTSVKNVGSNGYYWSSSYVNNTYAYGVYFHEANLNPQDCSNRTYGRGVRLVHVVE